MKIKAIMVISGIVLAMGCLNSEKAKVESQEEITTSSTNEVVLSSEINWGALNPARGDKSPQAGTIWGNRNGTEATGFLVRFVDGFASPPHIHNVTYRAMVIQGLIHNDDPGAEEMWMPAGSFWTQPAGESHITASKGESMVYVEIDGGPYLVKPTSESFDNGEQPVNISKDNLVWLGQSDSGTIENDKSEIALLWKNNGLKGILVKLSKGYSGEIQNQGNVFHAVVIDGEIDYQEPPTKTLTPGSYFTAKEKSKHALNLKHNNECLIYIRSNGDVRIK